MRFLFLVPILVLAACASPEEVAARKKRQAEEDAKICQSQNLAPGTGAFETCLGQQRMLRDQRKAEEAYHDAPPMSNTIYRYSY